MLEDSDNFLKNRNNWRVENAEKLVSVLGYVVNEQSVAIVVHFILENLPETCVLDFLNLLVERELKEHHCPKNTQQ